MRRLLLALIVFVGAGVSLAQVPRTYTRPGEAVVAAYANKPAEWWLGLIGTDVYVEGMHEIEVSFLGLDSTVYVGEIRVSDPKEFREFVTTYFYDSFCRTMIQFDCGRLRKIGSSEQPETGTGLDAFWEWVDASPTFGFTFHVNNPPPLNSAPAEWYCVNGAGSGRRWASFYTGVSSLSYGIGMGLAESGGYTWQWSGGAGNGFGPALTWAQGHMNSQCPLTGMTEFALGNYVYRGTSYQLPVVHPDLPVGVRIAAQEVSADIERVSGYAVLPRGLTWDPLPTAAQLGGDPTADPEQPGSGGGGGYGEAPEDGGTECNVLNIPCNLRRLFVPGEGVIEARIEDLQDVASTRFPFSVNPAGAFNQLMLANGHIMESFDPEVDCPRVGSELTTLAWEVVSPSGLAPEDGGYGGAFGVELRDGLNICTSPVIAWGHSTGRPLLTVLMYLALVSALLTRVFGGGRQ